MGFILFLILACGLPALILFVVQQRVPDQAWAVFPKMSPGGAPSPESRTERSAYLSGGTTGRSGTEGRMESVTATQGADLEHGLTSNTVRIDDAGRRQDGTTPIGSDPAHKRDSGSQAEAMGEPNQRKT